ncbi:MAG: hypothetical protein RIT27_934 [Pseudomonadota bacterium]|jgi:methyl-accepting chemotaxis protein
MTDSAVDDPQTWSDDELAHAALQKFNHTLELRNQMHIRVAMRVTSIIRVGMISIGGLVVAMFLLVLLLLWKFQDMVGAMTTMNQHFSLMSEDMSKMREMILKMDQSMQPMPTITHRVQTMDQSVAAMNQNMDLIAAKMTNMDYTMQQMRANVMRMTTTFSGMDQAVYGIGRDVNVMSKPMKDFNDLRSFVPLP